MDYADRLPPQNMDAEVSVLGSMILDNLCIGDVVQTLRADDFYSPDHRLIFEAAAAMHGDGVAVDVVTLIDRLRRDGSFERIGGAGTLTAMLERVPSAANVAHYADIVVRASARRHLIAGMTTAMRDAYDGTADMEATYQEVIGAVEGSRQRLSVDAGPDLRALARRAIDMLDGTGATWSSGNALLDAMIGGLREGVTITVGGRSKHGKTALAVGFLCATVEVGRRGMMVRYEEVPEAMLPRIASRFTGIAYGDVYMHRVPDDQRERFKDCIRQTGENWANHLAILPAMRIERIEAHVQKMRPSLLVVDTLQKMAHYHSKSKERHDLDVGSLTARLGDIAMKYNCCVVELSQLSRKASRVMPTTSDLRESGAIEEDSDYILLVWWPHKDFPEHNDDDFQTAYLMDVAKARLSGKCGRCWERISLGTQALDTMPDSQRAQVERRLH